MIKQSYLTSRAIRWFVSLLCTPLLLAAANNESRTRESFNLDWRFTHGDPTGTSTAFDYPSVRPWLLPMGAELLNDGHHTPSRPSGNLGEGVTYAAQNFIDTNWRSLDLPHDWGIEGPFDQAISGETGKLPWAGVGWYRKHFIAPRLDGGQRLSLQFDGAMANALVWCNGQFVGGWPYGYSSWQVDLTAAILPGVENVIAVRLEN